MTIEMDIERPNVMCKVLRLNDDVKFLATTTDDGYVESVAIFNGLDECGCDKFIKIEREEAEVLAEFIKAVL